MHAAHRLAGAHRIPDPAIGDSSGGPPALRSHAGLIRGHHHRRWADRRGPATHPASPRRRQPPVAAQWHTLLNKAGNLGAGSLSIGNTTAGVLVDDAVAGFPLLNAFGSGNTGYLHSVAFANTVASRLEVKDRIWHAGPSS